MNQKEYELIAGAIARTRMIVNMDKNRVRRQAKNDILNLVASDLVGSMKHEYNSFDQVKFLIACGM